MQELNGYIKLFRKLIRWGWYQDSVVKSLFLHCLLMASFKDFSWMEQRLKSGQFVTSYKRLAEDLGFSVQQIRTALKKLESTGEITSTSTNKFTVITVVNWENYQSEEDTSNTNSNNPITIEQQTNNKRTTNEQQHRKNIKNNKKIKNSSNARARVPQLSEILSFVSEEGLNVDGEKFFKHYSKNGWQTEDGKKITDWQKLLRVWDSKELKDKSVYKDGYSGVKYLGDD